MRVRFRNRSDTAMRRALIIAVIAALLILTALTVVVLYRNGVISFSEPREKTLETLTVPEIEHKYSEDKDGDGVVTEVKVEVDAENSECTADDGALDVISRYFAAYYSSLGSFKAQDVSDLFYFDTEYERCLLETMIDYQIRIRRGMDIDLTFPECTVGLTLISAEETDGGYDVVLYENNYMNYAFAGDVTSYTCGVEHDFLLTDSTDGWKIISHSEISGVYKLITERFDALVNAEKRSLATLTKGQIADVFAGLNDTLVSEADHGVRELYLEKLEYNEDPDDYALKEKADHPYDADAAVAYSYEWAGKYQMKRNPDFFAFDDYGGNCNNFTSQCILAGGVPMDITGDINRQWKYYGTGIENAPSAKGRSMSWTGVEYFWDYARKNGGRGMSCETNKNLFCARPGDIVQYVSGGVGVHSVIVTKVIRDADGNVVELMINSNTTDKVDCPMSIYGYTEFRLIRVVGWND